MNNVINLPPRQRIKYRTWSYQFAASVSAAACAYTLLASIWPDVFAHWLSGLLMASAVLVANGLAACFYAQEVQLRREHARQVRQSREARKARRDAQRRAVMEAPTQVLQILPPRPVVSQTTYVPDAWEDHARRRLMEDLTERTGDIFFSADAPPPSRRATGAA